MAEAPPLANVAPAVARSSPAAGSAPDSAAGSTPNSLPAPGSAPDSAPGSALLELVAVMDRLYSPGGCPWDAEQTHRSLLPYLIEEAYEVVDAVEGLTADGNPAAADAELAEELGDLLLQVVFHARVAQGRAAFDIDDVAGAIVAKLRRRHPHVFPDGSGERSGGEPPTDAVAVQAGWEQIKRAEKPDRGPVDGIPRHLPALARADKLLGRAERAGLATPADLRAGTEAGTAAGPGTGTSSGFASGPDSGTGPGAESGTGPGTDSGPGPGTGAAADDGVARVGAQLFEAVREARRAGVDPEAALRLHVRLLESSLRESAERGD